MNELTIRCTNNGQTLHIPFGGTLYDAYRMSGLQLAHGPVCAFVNNKVQGMHYRFYNPKDVEFLTLTDQAGMQTYCRSLLLLLVKAVEDVLPDGRLNVRATISNGYYCTISMGRPLTAGDVQLLRAQMQHIVEQALPFHRIQCPVEEAIELFRQRGMESKAQLLSTSEKLYAYYYQVGDTIDYFYGCLLTNTSQLTLFSLEAFQDGLLLLPPTRQDPTQVEQPVRQDKVLDVVREHQRWQQILGVSRMGEFNQAVEAGYASDLINVSEALQEKKLSAIVDEIVSRGAHLVLLAGPSSSGKTTTAKRLSVLLMASGLRPRIISTDDYFVNRVDTPKDAHGEYDFECIGAVDTAFFNQQMQALLRGEEVELPRYDFPSGQRVFEGKKLRLGQGDVIVLEGNHALNPLLSAQLPEEEKYRIFVSALTSIQLDDHNFVSTQDIRLLRRILRDYKYRGYSARETIHRCPSVTAGEERWILPFQEYADATFNSALLYEFGVMREQVMPLLEQVPERCREYAEASRLRLLLQYCRIVPRDQVPPTSLLREFAGGSSFRY